MLAALSFFFILVEEGNCVQVSVNPLWIHEVFPPKLACVFGSSLFQCWESQSPSCICTNSQCQIIFLFLALELVCFLDDFHSMLPCHHLILKLYNSHFHWWNSKSVSLKFFTILLANFCWLCLCSTSEWWYKWNILLSKGVASRHCWCTKLVQLE